MSSAVNAATILEPDEFAILRQVMCGRTQGQTCEAMEISRDRYLEIFGTITRKLGLAVRGMRPIEDGEDRPLTAMERRCLTLIRDGAAVQDVCRELIIADGTVRNHIHKARRKLRARNRTEAVVKAIRRKAIPLGEER